MTLIDTHAHISYEDYTDRIDEIIHSAKENGIEKIICVGVDLSSSENCLKLTEKYPSLYATCGIHPHDADNAPKGYLYELETFSQHPKMVAIGEIGLDFYYDFSDRKVQKRVYYEQLEMAQSLELPAVIHCRESDEDILEGIQNIDNIKGVIHCFSSTVDFAQNIIDSGLHISFTGMITFVKELEEVVKNIPLEKMMLETDSPYLSPKPFRGKQNEPKNVLYIAEKIAELKEVSIEEVAYSTTKTALNLFKKLNAN